MNVYVKRRVIIGEHIYVKVGDNRCICKKRRVIIGESNSRCHGR